MSPKTLLSFAILLGVVLNPAAALADWHRHSHIEFRFHQPRDHHRWNHGRWHHGYHDGRWGWWWLVAGSWYYFNKPVYPYPSSDAPPAPAAYPPPPSGPSPSLSSPYWYYCKPTNSYYPYVTTCTEGWTQVAASPPVQE